MQTTDFLKKYSQERPLFLSVLRAKEAAQYQQFLPLKHPVLDVGCGDGFFASVTFGSKKIDIGLDMESSRIIEANGVYKKTVTFNGYTMPFRNKQFRTIVVNSVLEHVDDLPRVLSQMRRVLATNGVCYATVMAAPWEMHLFGAKIFGDWYRRWMKKRQVHVNLLTHAEWRRAFTKAGFRVQSVTPYLSPRAAMWLDIQHYLSVPSLISYAINGQWVWWPRFTRLYPLHFFADCMDESVPLEDAGALFFVLKR